MDEQPKLGLALSGGGVRGLTHIGVLKVLQREGITPYCITGASMGAIIGALFASGKLPDEIENSVTELLVGNNMFKLVDLAYPWHGLFGGHNAVKWLQEQIGADMCVENCGIKLGVSAVDLIERKLVYVTDGNLVDALRASMSLIGMFTPHVHNGQRLADGGYLDNLPAGLAREMGADVVIAVDVGAEFPYTSGDDNGNPTDSKLPIVAPPVVQDLFQVNIIMVQEVTRLRLERARPEVLLTPKLPAAVGILSGLDLVPDVIAAGAKAAEEALPQIKEILVPHPPAKTGRWWHIPWSRRVE